MLLGVLVSVKVLFVFLCFTIFRFLLSSEILMAIWSVRVWLFGAIPVLFFVVRLELPEMSFLETFLEGLIESPMLVVFLLSLVLLTVFLVFADLLDTVGLLPELVRTTDRTTDFWGLLTEDLGLIGLLTSRRAYPVLLVATYTFEGWLLLRTARGLDGLLRVEVTDEVLLVLWGLTELAGFLAVERCLRSDWLDPLFREELAGLDTEGERFALAGLDTEGERFALAGLDAGGVCLLTLLEEDFCEIEGCLLVVLDLFEVVLLLEALCFVGALLRPLEPLFRCSLAYNGDINTIKATKNSNTPRLT